MRIHRLILVPVLATIAAAAFGADDSKPVALAQTPPAVQKAIAARVGDGTLEAIDQSSSPSGASYDVDYLAKSGTEGGFSVTDTGEINSVEITLHDAPAVVQKAIQTNAAGSPLQSIDVEADGSYDVDVTKAGADQYFTVGEDGTLLSASVAMADTPPTVQAAIQAQTNGGWLVIEIDRNMDDVPATYDVELSRAGQEKGITIGVDGSLTSQEASLSAAPAPVQATVHRLVGAGKVTGVEQNMDPDGVTYDVEAVSPQGVALDFSVGPGGEEQSVMVPLNQVPPLARATIVQTIGVGQILRIDRSLTEKQGKVLPYMVEGQKNGTAFDFSVGPKGKFLGMDQ